MAAGDGPVVLCILDGWGLSDATEANAVARADTPTFDRLMAEGPAATLTTHGPAVGLPEGQMGNSEVGHTNIGAGRTVWMDLPKIDRAIADGSFDDRPALTEFIAALRASGGTAHLMGLTSPGGVHAHQDHCVAAARRIAAAGIPVLIHAITDGRDVAPKSAGPQIAALEAALPAGAAIASVTGRFFAMDRDQRWERVAAAAALILEGADGPATSAAAAIAAAYARGETDEFIAPTPIAGKHRPAADGDGLFFLNFRADRAREILSALADPAFEAAPLPPRPSWAAVAGMVEYSEAHNAFMSALFPSEPIANTLGAVVAAAGKTQFRVAETEKYPHVTFFLNGGQEATFPGETRHMAPSPKVKTYDLAPSMAAEEVAQEASAAIRSRRHALVVINFANPDMVGHTGDLAAAEIACASVDRGLAELVAAVEATGGAMLVTADHGNCEMMVDPATGGPHTAHTLNPVPVCLVGGPAGQRLRPGVLGDLAPTLLALMGLSQPAEMTGQSLLHSA